MQILSSKQILILRDVTAGNAHETLPNAENGTEVTALALGTTNNLILVGTVNGGSDLTIAAGGSAVLHKTGSGWWTSGSAASLGLAGVLLANGTVAATGNLDLDGNDVLDVGLLQADSIVDPGGTGPSLELSSSEIVATGKGSLQTPLSVDGVLGVTANLQEWRVNGSPLSSIAADGGLTAPSVTLPDAGAPVDAVAATGTVSTTGTPGDGNTVTINSRVYTFKTALTPANDEILIDGQDNSLTNLEHAINNSGGVPGTDYQVATANADVTAGDVGTHAITLTAIVKGVSGNSISLDKTGTNVKVNAGDVPTSLGAGTDGTPGTENQIIANNGVAYLCTATATVATAGAWKKITIESL